MCPVPSRLAGVVTSCWTTLSFSTCSAAVQVKFKAHMWAGFAMISTLLAQAALSSLINDTVSPSTVTMSVLPSL